MSKKLVLGLDIGVGSVGWRILFIEESDSISLYLDNVKIKKALVRQHCL